MKPLSQSLTLWQRQYKTSCWRKQSCSTFGHRQVDDAGGHTAYQRVAALHWRASELKPGKLIKIKGFPKDHKVQCFRVVVSTHRTDVVVTHELTQDSIEATQQACGFRGNMEPLHREGNQLTGLEACQGRKARIQRKHIGCAFLVWVSLNALAQRAGQTVYQRKHGLLDAYLCPQLKKPSLTMAFA